VQDSDLSLVLVLERLAPRPDALWLPRRLFPVLWRILEHRYRNRPLPQKVTKASGEHRN
jgi:hypothetical protein